MTITSSFGYRSEALDVIDGVDLRGAIAIVTGAASGIGLETARALAAAGAVVVTPVRDRARGEIARDDIVSSHPDAEVDVAAMDLASLSSVRSFARDFCERYGQLDILINNAGVMATPFEYTADGVELQFGTNHLGHFALFEGLLVPLRSADGSRVVALTSIGHRLSDVDFDDVNFEQRDYDKWIAYGQSKTACSLFAVALTEHYERDGIFANAVHPGGIMTGLQKHMELDEQRRRGWIDEHGVVNEGFKTTTQGAATSVWAAVAPELSGVGGLYLEDCHEATAIDPSAPMVGRMDYAVDPDHARQLWELSMELAH
jgi:NAD(P)-dependent dehydrogenase (short-subunit alcohol dehydrogenase family)